MMYRSESFGWLIIFNNGSVWAIGDLENITLSAFFCNNSIYNRSHCISEQAELLKFA